MRAIVLSAASIPNSPLPGLELATRLIVEWCGGEAIPMSVIAGKALPPPHKHIEFDPGPGRNAGRHVAVAKDEIIAILQKGLGFVVAKHASAACHPAQLAARY